MRRKSRQNEPVDILASPRGRRFCANVVYLCNSDGDVLQAERRRADTPTEACAEIAAMDIPRVSAFSELDLLWALGMAVDFARYWQPPDDEDVLLADPEVVAALRPIADTVMTAPPRRVVAEPIDLDGQRLAHFKSSSESWPQWTRPQLDATAELDEWRRHVTATEARHRARRPSHASSGTSGQWWSIPGWPSKTVETTRALPELGPLSSPWTRIRCRKTKPARGRLL